MIRLFPLRRSFSLDLAPDDSNSNFLLHSNDDSNMAGGEEHDSTPPGAGEPSTSSAHIFSSPHLHISKSNGASLLASNMTTAVQWQVNNIDDVDDGLAADFDGSLSGLGMELGTSSYNMSEALMALPNIPALKTSATAAGGGGGHHHHHHHHHLHHLHHDPSHHPHHHHAHPLAPSNFLLTSSLQSSVLRPSETPTSTAATSSAISERAHSLDGALHITENVSNGTSTSGSNGGGGGGGDMEVTVTTLAHGKKNRLAYGNGDDEHGLSNSIKRFCFDRDDNNGNHLPHNIQVLLPGNLIQQVHHTALSSTSGSSIGDDGGGQACGDDFYNDADVGGTSMRHSNSVPDLRTSFSSPGAVAAHISGAANERGRRGGGVEQTQSINSAASSPASSTSTSTPNSLFSQMLASSSQYQNNNNNHNSGLQSTSGNNLLAHDFNLGGGGGGFPSMQKDCNESAKFQYVLGASTSMAIKQNEETMTYLNQGQSYEIKLKKVGDLTEMKGKMLKTIIQVCFHDRRLQYMEKDLIGQWREQRPQERILEIDVPLSYGVHDVRLDNKTINKTEFTWDPTKETGVFIRINCISTEFTPKKHGGEKGVPFRIVIETYSADELDASQCLHAASCQVKVFKPKGADRKHKTDREKLSKKPALEQEKFQQPLHCTVLIDCSVDTFRLYHGLMGNGGGGGGDGQSLSNSSSFDLGAGNASMVIASTKAIKTSPPSLPVAIKSQPKPLSPPSPTPSLDKETSPFKLSSSGVTSVFPDDNSFDLNFSNFSQSFFRFNVLSSSSSAEDVTRWLKEKRFDLYLDTFSNWSGSDLLLLSKEEVIQICGLSNGIRLFNALHCRTVKSRLSLYVSLAVDDIFRAIYLETLTTSELQSKLISNLMKSKCGYLKRLCLMGPSDVKILVTDDVVKNLPNESIYSIEFTKDYTGEYQALMRPLNK